MARKSPSENVYVMTLPLVCEPWQRDRLDTLFQVCNDIKNNLIAYEERQYENLVARKDWRAIQQGLADAYGAKEPDTALIKDLCSRRNALIETSGFSSGAFEKQINKYRKHYKGPDGKGYLVNIHIVQKISMSVWSSFQSLLYKNGKEVHFSRWSEFTTITAKSNATGIVYQNGVISISNMDIPVMLDKQDPYGYQEESLSRTIRYCGISRRWYASGWKYFVQLTLDGLPPVKVHKDTGELRHPMGNGRVGHDIGTQTIASCGQNAVMLTELADKVRGIDAELRRINRAMDRSRRATNPLMFNSDGTVVSKENLPPECLNKRGSRHWNKSKRYIQLESKRRELYRRQREMRIQQHNELANRLLSFGDEHYIEDMRFRALAKRVKETRKNAKGKFVRKKRFGRSISNKAPAAFVKTLEKKVRQSGGSFSKVNTFTVKASQLNHITETYTKKSLGKRWNTMPDGSKVQRDLYSAFLLMNVDPSLSQVDIQQCNKTYKTFIQLHNEEIKRISNTIGTLGQSSMGIKHIA